MGVVFFYTFINARLHFLFRVAKNTLTPRTENNLNNILFALFFG